MLRIRAIQSTESLIGNCLRWHAYCIVGKFQEVHIISIFTDRPASAKITFVKWKLGDDVIMCIYRYKLVTCVCVQDGCLKSVCPHI